MANPRFDLIDITQTLHHRKRLILIVSLLCAAVAAIFYLVSKKKYEAKVEFFVSNPLYSDRNNLFRQDEARFVDYFSNEDDMDKVIALANSRLVRDQIRERQQLDKDYNLDMSKPKDWLKFEEIFRKNYEIKRADYQNMEISFTNTNAVKAANVANEAVTVLEEVYHNYFNTIRKNIHTSIARKAAETDSTINVLTDTLAKLRDKYQIYDIISPARQTITVSSIKSNGTESFGRGVEEIQNVEAIKDQLVKDRAGYASLLNEFSTGTQKDEMALIQIISLAEPPVNPKGPGLILTTLAGLFIGFFFSAIFILISTYYRLLTSSQRTA